MQTSILGRENGEEKYSAHNFLTLRKGENILYLRLPPWCTYFFMYPYEHMIAMECKEVCILGEVQVFVLEKLCWTAVCGYVCALQIVIMTKITVCQVIALYRERGGLKRGKERV